MYFDLNLAFNFCHNEPIKNILSLQNHYHGKDNACLWNGDVTIG